MLTRGYQSNMAIRHLFSCLAFLCLGQLVSAGNFINPPPSDSEIDNPVYELGQRLKIRWQADAEFTDLTMWQTDTGQRYNLQCKFEENALRKTAS
jgi:hypothetical protein